MASEVDSLSIKISAKSQEANAQVDKLISKLSSLSKSLGSVELRLVLLQNHFLALIQKDYKSFRAEYLFLEIV